MIRILIGFVLSLFLGVALMPFVIAITKRFKANQPILGYVESHAVKSGTPTMGGIGILLAAAFPFALLLRGDASTALICLIVALGYGVIGFTDDYLKIKGGHNKGLTVKWKLFLQLLVACLVSAYAFFASPVKGTVLLPFTASTADLSYFAPVYYVFIFLSFTNSVNLTDGLDGLAASVTTAFLTCFAVVLFIVAAFMPSEVQTNEMLLIACFCGALCGFLCFNRYPARIFMGDTGSLALGGMLASLSVLTGLSLFAALIGIMYVVSAVSVIIQVTAYKLTKKRVFLMSPLHHHFEKKGIHENHIVAGYTAATLSVGAGVIILTLLFCGIT